MGYLIYNIQDRWLEVVDIIIVTCAVEPIHSNDGLGTEKAAKDKLQ